jgi:diaminopimelate decarboxylase
MADKKLPVSDERMLELASQLDTPFHLYDEKAIRENAEDLIKAFSWAPKFVNFFAVKACPNPAIISILAKLGFGADCSSYPELILAEKAGIPADRIVLTSNDTPDEEFLKAYEMGAIINLDDVSHIDTLERVLGCLPERICFRFNPGPEREGNVIIGNPVEAKYGVTRAQLFDAYKYCKEHGVKSFGLHTMVASNELDESYIVLTAKMIFDLAIELKKRLDIDLDFVDFGGGVGIPYKPEQERISFASLSKKIEALYNERDLKIPMISFEMGRAITGPYGYLVAKVRHVTHKYKDYVGLDACMADLMRPALYGAYHHITVVGKEDKPLDHVYDVTGSLCENNDKFAIDRKLPEIEKGDVLVLHDTGAHGYAMGFNYNAKLKHAEYLLKEDGSVKMIRRAETMDDYFATLRF